MCNAMAVLYAVLSAVCLWADDPILAAGATLGALGWLVAATLMRPRKRRPK